MGLKPGRWRTTIRVIEATALPESGADVPERVKAGLRQQVGSSTETEDCIGSRRAPRGDLLLPGIKIGADCTFAGVSADKHSLKLKASCGSLSEGFQADVRVDASHTDVVMRARAETSAFSKAAGFRTKLIVTTSSTYAGQCAKP
jgi:hypothetical protein